MNGLRVNGERLWDSLMTMAEIGATANGGVNRQTLTDEDRRGRDLFRQWCEGAGLGVSVDRMGSMFCRRAGRDDERPPVLLGSHLDSQPTGGKFDGALGVLAALEVVRTLNDHGIETAAPLEVVNWTNEEGCRFAPAMVASGVFAGVFDLDYGLSRRDHAGRTIGEELAAHRLRRRARGRRPRDRRPVRAAHRAGADPRGRGPAHRHRDRRPGRALVRLRGHGRRDPRRPGADGGPARCAARRGRAARGHLRGRAPPRPAGPRDDRRVPGLSRLAQHGAGPRALHGRPAPSRRRDDGPDGPSAARGLRAGARPPRRPHRLRGRADLVRAAGRVRSGLHRRGARRRRWRRACPRARSSAAPATMRSTWRASCRPR